MASLFLVNQPNQAEPSHLLVGFLIGMPVALLLLVRLGFRWATMASVMYGTVGLALDLSTMVQLITKDRPTLAMLTACGFSGFLNFLVITFGGRAFLDGPRAPLPPESRPPNPPFPASSATP